MNLYNEGSFSYVFNGWHTKRLPKLTRWECHPETHRFDNWLSISLRISPMVFHCGENNGKKRYAVSE